MQENVELAMGCIDLTFEPFIHQMIWLIISCSPNSSSILCFSSFITISWSYFPLPLDKAHISVIFLLCCWERALMSLLFLELEMGLWGCCIAPPDNKQLGLRNKQNIRCSIAESTIGVLSWYLITTIMQILSQNAWRLLMYNCWSEFHLTCRKLFK